jgi:hypothetical protein
VTLTTIAPFADAAAEALAPGPDGVPRVATTMVPEIRTPPLETRPDPTPSGVQRWSLGATLVGDVRRASPPITGESYRQRQKAERQRQGRRVV